MSERLDQESRSVLEYRPNISFVHPEVASEEPDPVDYAKVSAPGDGVARLKELQQMAKNVKAVAEKVQERADQLASGFEVELDTTTDGNCIRALQRHYPGANPLKVTYEQYKQCKEHQRKLMEEMPGKILNPLKESEIKKAEKALAEGNASEFLISTGRSDNDPLEQIIPPMDIDAVQDSCLRALANMLWKNFVKPVIPLPPGVSFLPDEIAPMPDGPSPDEMMGQAHQKSGGSK
jgi:hypothetical protein